MSNSSVCDLGIRSCLRPASDKSFAPDYWNVNKILYIGDDDGEFMTSLEQKLQETIGAKYCAKIEKMKAQLAEEIIHMNEELRSAAKSSLNVKEVADKQTKFNSDIHAIKLSDFKLSDLDDYETSSSIADHLNVVMPKVDNMSDSQTAKDLETHFKTATALTNKSADVCGDNLVKCSNEETPNEKTTDETNISLDVGRSCELSRSGIQLTTERDDTFDEEYVIESVNTSVTDRNTKLKMLSDLHLNIMMILKDV